MIKKSGDIRNDQSLAQTNRDNRDKLIVEYAPLVKNIANRMAMRLPPHIDQEELVSAGTVGLLDAIDKYDPGKQTKFKTYAEFRIRGSMLDALRNMDWVPRSVRRQAREMEKAYFELEQRFGRQATDEELAAELGLEEQELFDVLSQVKSVSLISLNETVGEEVMGRRQEIIDYLVDPNSDSPFQELHLAQLKRSLGEAIEELPEKPRLVLTLYYFEELNMKEIGEVLDITESRVSQIHSKTLLYLRGKLKNVL
ncbi:MAG: FliA/WhiG family RNA polymerase sigma factor [Deltaproteobacteria bacterium]|nr:FliA/WhiG family RNA polymerase sigma factor [Deltaproteobacteria bacterium]